LCALNMTNAVIIVKRSGDFFWLPNYFVSGRDLVPLRILGGMLPGDLAWFRTTTRFNSGKSKNKVDNPG
jgi:hypothetical protein